MANVRVNLSKIKYNAKVLQSLLERRHIHFTPVIKCVAGDKRIVSSIKSLGITHFAESRLDNIEQLKDLDITFTLLRPTVEADLEKMISRVEMSIQTELTTIKKLNTLAKSLDIKHQIMLMVDWKDGREGVLTYDVVRYVQEVLRLSHIQLVGLAFNFMCFKSEAPNEKDVRMINKFIHNVENETHFKFRIISGGNSSMLPQTLYNHLDKINDLRIGEALLRGIDTTTNHSINSLYQNAIVLEAEIIEIKPLGNDIRILGASSDHLMIDLNNQDHYQIGDKLQFSLNYEALSQSMYMKNLTKLYSSDSKIESLVQNFDMPIYSQC